MTINMQWKGPLICLEDTVGASSVYFSIWRLLRPGPFEFVMLSLEKW